MTGSFSRMDIRGRDDEPLSEHWEAGPKTYLGLSVVGFPNMFMITGPGSPSVLSNMPVTIEQNVEWISDLIEHAREHDVAVIEADADAEAKMTAVVNAMKEQAKAAVAKIQQSLTAEKVAAVTRARQEVAAEQAKAAQIPLSTVRN